MNQNIIGWKPLRSAPPEIGEMVIGYNEKWVDGGYNPKGVRECFRNGDGTQWLCARWNNSQDCWETAEEAPTHWMPCPVPPVSKKADGRVEAVPLWPSLADVEREHIQLVVRSTGSLTDAASHLRINRATLFRKLKAYKQENA